MLELRYRLSMTNRAITSVYYYPDEVGIG